MLSELFLILFWFLVGLIESFLLSVEAKFLQRNHLFGIGVTSITNTLIFLFILGSIFEYLSKLDIKFAYAVGVMLGTICAVKFDLYLIKLAKHKGINSKFLKKEWRKFQRRFR
jgi:uncharacterized protein YebE (UPF0316 family)